jgi:hypothetical protein
MVNLTRCDKCGKEMPKQENFFEGFEADDFEIVDSKKNLKKLLKPHLCEKCVKGYNILVDRANKEISLYIKKR